MEMFTYVYNEETKEFDIYDPNGDYVKSISNERSAIMYCHEESIKWANKGLSDYEAGKSPDR